MWFNPFVYQYFTNVIGKQLHVKKRYITRCLDINYCVSLHKR